MQTAQEPTGSVHRTVDYNLLGHPEFEIRNVGVLTYREKIWKRSGDGPHTVE